MKEIKKIIMEYDDGQIQTIEKGCIMEIKAVDDETENISFMMCNISGKDLSSIVMAVIGLGERLGMFKDNEV